MEAPRVRVWEDGRSGKTPEREDSRRNAGERSALANVTTRREPDRV